MARDPLQLSLPTEFTSQQLYCRRYRAGDGAVYHQMLQENWDHLYEFMPQEHLEIGSADDAEVILGRLASEWDSRNLFIFGAWERASGDYVGECYLANPHWEVPCIEVGYFIVQACTGRGYATEAAHAMLRYAFTELGVERVELQCRADNVASQRVAERCGFTLEGRFRRRHCKKSGTLVDVLWYGLLSNEWRAFNNKTQVDREHRE